MARNEQLIRQHKVLQILERSRFGRTLEEIRDDLVDELGLTSLHTRSVRRDLEALQAAGFDVESHEIQRGRVWKLGPRFRGTQKITVSVTELVALSLSRELLFPLSGTPFWIGIESFWSKIRESLPPAVWHHYEQSRKILHVLGITPKSYENQQGIIRTIHRAIQQHRVLQIHYQTLGEPAARQRKIEPYGLVVYQSSLYIVAAVSGASDDLRAMRHWKLDRFQKAEALDEYFRPRKDFQLESHLGKSMGIFAGEKTRKFRIRISAYAAPWVLEDPWHPQQIVEHRRDGSLVLTVTAAHELEIIPRVLALGTEAEVLTPASCRKAIGQIVSRLGEMYE